MSGSSQVWFVTGAAAGIGRAIVEAALERGDRVVAAARSPGRLAHLAEAHPGQLLTVALDVTDRAAAGIAVRSAVERFGRIDVLVNNAGYGRLSPFEGGDEAEFRAQIETNFYGVVNLCREVVPVMRRQGAGRILNISSSAGRVAAPGMTAYCAGKFAVSGFSESLAREVAPLGVQVVSVEPGSFRTGWTRAAGQDLPAFDEPYATLLAPLVGMATTHAGMEPGDPVRLAWVIWEMSRRDDLPEHLILGPDAVQMVEQADAAREAAARAWRSVSLSTNFLT